MNNKIALESLVMDLKRIALGYHRGSLGMANRFSQEALKRKSEIDLEDVKPYIKTIISKLDRILTHKDVQKIADDALMTSILLQNYIQTSL
jgi:hypothetical protein